MVEGRSSLTFGDRFKGLTSFRLGKSGWAEKIWQPGSYDHLITADDAMEEIVDYILENPVRSGLCEAPDGNPWSGIAEPIA